ncbi:MAG: DUF3597 domain-containing protein [Gemmatimonas sp.]
MRARDPQQESQMSILGNIFSKIFGHRGAGATASPTGPTGAAGSSSTASTPAAPAPMTEVDVEALLTDMAAKYSHPVNWRSSIVDLMSMLGIDNSLAERRALADELGYSGDKQDTATMNMWLHKQVMKKLAANGGKVPADLLD